MTDEIPENPEAQLQASHEIQLWLSKVTNDFAQKRKEITLVDLSDLAFMLKPETCAQGVQTADALTIQMKVELDFWEKYSEAYKKSFADAEKEGVLTLSAVQLSQVFKNIDEKQIIRSCIYAADLSMLEDTLALTDIMYESKWQPSEDGFAFTGDDAEKNSERFSALVDSIQKAESIHDQSMKGYKNYTENKDNEASVEMAQQFLKILK